LCEKLATFATEPAVFYRKAPADAELIDGSYPQIVLTTKNFSEAVTIGTSNFGDTFKPSRVRPAIYFDAQRIQLLSQTATAVFLSATINAHIFADTVKARRR